MLDWMQCVATFCKVVEEKGFSHAAQKLNVNPSAVSKHIKWLETTLGVQLLERSTRHVRLTDLGNQFYQRSKKILEQWEYLKDEVSDRKETIQGHLRIASTRWFGENVLTPIVLDYMQQHLKVTVDLVLMDRIIDPVNDEIDICITSDNLVHTSANLHKIPVDNVYKKLFASKNYLAKFGKPRSLAELKEHRLISINAGLDRTETWELNGKSFVISGKLNVNGVAGAIEAIKKDLGILYFVPINKLIDDPTIVNVLPEYCSKETEICLYFTPKPYISYLMESCIDYLVSVLSSTPMIALK